MESCPLVFPGKFKKPWAKYLYMLWLLYIGPKPKKKTKEAKEGDKDVSVIYIFNQYWIKIKRLSCALTLTHIFVFAFPRTWGEMGWLGNCQMRRAFVCALTASVHIQSPIIADLSSCHCPLLNQVLSFFYLNSYLPSL